MFWLPCLGCAKLDSGTFFAWQCATLSVHPPAWSSSGQRHCELRMCPGTELTSKHQQEEGNKQTNTGFEHTMQPNWIRIINHHYFAEGLSSFKLGQPFVQWGLHPREQGCPNMESPNMVILRPPPTDSVRKISTFFLIKKP